MKNIKGKIFELKQTINLEIDSIDLKYRKGPSLYFYEKVIELRKCENSISKFIDVDKNIEYLYATLVAWDMDSRGANLKYFDEFKESIKQNTKYFLDIERNETNLPDINLGIIKPILERLYKGINIMQSKSKLVSVSKLLHFLFPNLVMPMDRTNTLEYFYNNTSESKNKFLEIFEFSYCLAKENIRWANIVGKQKWNTSIPKVIDNAIILKLDKSTKK